MQKKLEDRSIIIIAGPTASGKSDLAIELAETLGNAEILCADSITVYKKFEIGSAKPSMADQKRVPHHLIDLVDSTKNFTAGDFIKFAHPIIDDMRSRKKIPILVGGTGFYLRALLKGMITSEEDEKNALSVKEALAQRADVEGWEKLYAELLEKDPAAKKTVHQNDHYRILRALQAMQISGKLWSEANKEAKSSTWKYPARFFCLKLEKEILKERIEARTKKMIQLGLLEEVNTLISQGVSPRCKPMQSVGYKECVEFLEGKIPLEQLHSQISQETLKLTKRQMTWFRGEDGVEWLEPDFLFHLKESLMLE